MFHEFGHMLHGVLSEARYVGQSGTSVADDFVELPSQFAENWCWEPAYLKQLSRHYKTGKSLSVDVIEKLVDSRTFLTILGERHARVQANTWLDFIVHTKKNVSDISGLYRQMCKKYYAGIEAPKNTLFPAGFGHIGGGYDARYYVYNWALVYAYDCYSRFQKEGIFNKNVGRQFAREILAVGSSRSEMDSLKKFLGRSPRPGAFLKTLESSQ